MSQKKKQTARKTTGNHLEFTSILAGRTSPPISRPAKRVRHARTTVTSANAAAGASTSTRPKSLPSPPKSILMSRPTIVSPPVTLPLTTSASASHDVHAPLPTSGPSTHGATGTLVRRRAAGLDVPISVCTQFATWLENQTCVHNETLLGAVERDGRHLLSLARATVMFDHALRGNAVPPSLNGIPNPLSEHARTLRVFAELLKSKISEGDLSGELEAAVLRDGEALFRLALTCLDFDQAIRGSSNTT